MKTSHKICLPDLLNTRPQHKRRSRIASNHHKPAMDDPGILFKLPPELRLQIYNYVLLRPVEEQHVVPTIRKRLSPEAMRRRAMNLKRHAAEGRTRLPISVKTALLSVNKHISLETGQVIYGNHKFIFKTAQALDHFLIHIGENKQHLRHVEVTSVLEARNFRAIGRISDNLTKAAKELRCFKLHFDGRYLLIHGGSVRGMPKLEGEMKFGGLDSGAFLEKLA